MADLSIFDPGYVQRMQTENLRRMAAEQNTMRVQRYNQASADWITNAIRCRDLGIALPALPVIPKKIVVDDDGNWTEVSFPDLTTPVLPPPVAPQVNGSLRATNVPPDRLDQALWAIQQCNNKLESILAILREAK